MACLTQEIAKRVTPTFVIPLMHFNDTGIESAQVLVVIRTLEQHEVMGAFVLQNLWAPCLVKSRNCSHSYILL